MDKKQKRSLTNALLACPNISERERRNAIINDLPADIKHNITRNSNDKIEVNNLVKTCLNYEGGLQELIETLKYYEGETSESFQKVEKIIEEFADNSAAESSRGAVTSSSHQENPQPPIKHPQTNETNTTYQFDVFLSHSNDDKNWVSKLKADLLRYGVSVWLDKDELRPGSLSAKALEQALDNCRAVALIISPAAITSGWVEEEYYRALDLAQDKQVRLQLIPVILGEAKLPGFLQNRTPIDFQVETLYAEKVRDLVWGIRGHKPNKILDLTAPEVVISTPTQPETPTTTPPANNLPQKSQKVIKILFLASNPADGDRLGLDQEIRAIDEAIQGGDYRDKFKIEQHWAVQVADLQKILLRHKPDIVHFSGHGSQASEIILEDNAGYSQTVPASALSRLFKILKDNIRCVVLNACYSEQQATAIAEHIDCVIGMSQAIGDVAAINFATSFYQALVFGRDLQTAFDLGCLQIDLEALNEQDTPQLLAPNSNPKNIILVL